MFPTNKIEEDIGMVIDTKLIERLLAEHGHRLEDIAGELKPAI
jgi:hypothetical protein